MQRAAILFASTLSVSAATNFFDYDVEDADDEHVMRILLDTEINMHHNTDAMTLAGYGSQIVDAGSGVFMGGSGDAFVGSSFADGGDGPVPGHPTHPTVHHDDSNHEGFEGSADYFGADGTTSFEGSADDVSFDDASAAPVDSTAAPVMLGGNGRQTNCATVTPCCVGTEAQTSALQAADGSCSCDSVDCTTVDTSLVPVHTGDHSGDQHTVHFEGSADDSGFEGSSDSLSHASGHQGASTGSSDSLSHAGHSGSGSGDWDHEFGAGSADTGFEAGSGAAVVFHGDHDASSFEGSSDSLAHGTVQMAKPTFEGSGTGDHDGTEHSGFKHGSH